MKIQLQQVSVRGPARMKYLAPEAAASLAVLERDTSGLIYTDLWRDPVASLMARRKRSMCQVPGYSGHNYGIGACLDIQAILNEKKISYEDLLYLLKKRGWFCYRRDGDPSKHDAEHFAFLGERSEKYLSKTTLDPTTWQRPTEEMIYERHGPVFQLNLEQVQDELEKLGFYVGPRTTTIDAYLREGILAFQRAWDLVEDGNSSMQLQRVLAFVAAEIDLRR